MIVRVNNVGKGTIAHSRGFQPIPWKEQFDMHGMEEDWVDEWLESADNSESAPRTIRRVETPVPVLRRQASPVIKRAAQQRWDSQVADLQRHVSSVLDQLGNGRR